MWPSAKVSSVHPQPQTLTYALSGSSPSTIRAFLLLASSKTPSHSFSACTAPRSPKIASNSVRHPSPNLAFNCFHTPSKAAGQCFAGVGKHAAKLACECVRIVVASAVSKMRESAVARGPGVEAVGAGGGAGEGERAAGPGIEEDVELKGRVMKRPIVRQKGR